MGWDSNSVSKQISVVHGNQKLVEFLNELIEPAKQYPSHLYAQGEEKSEGGYNINSLLRLQIVDYSKKSGKDNVITYYNIKPNQINYMLNLIIHAYTFETAVNHKFEDKIAGNRVTKCSISRYPTDDKGQKRKYPWMIGIEEGTAQSQKNATGGTYIKSGTYKSVKKQNIFITDEAMHELFWTANMAVEKFIISGKWEGCSVARKSSGEEVVDYERNIQPQSENSKKTSPAVPSVGMQVYTVISESRPMITNQAGAYKILGRIADTNESCEIIFISDMVKQLAAVNIWQQLEANADKGLRFTFEGQKYVGPVTQLLVLKVNL